MKFYKRVLNDHPRVIKRKLENWSLLTKKHAEFYRSLLANKIKLDKKTAGMKTYLAQKSQARYQLEDFNYKKQVEVFKFWINQPESLRSLYVLETILFNEVGSLDGSLGQERESVGQVVLNRRVDSYYSRLPEDDPLRKYLVNAGLKKEQIEDPWLALLLKQGEFSFTYFFIESSVRVYCLDQTRRGRKLRRDNLRIASQLINSPEWGFLGMRYFSRHSMLGRIKMNRLWDSYQPLPERPGRRVIKSYKLQKQFKSGRYQYFDSFSFKGRT